MSATTVPSIPGWQYGPRPDTMQAFNYFVNNREYIETTMREVQRLGIFWAQRDNVPNGFLPTESIRTDIPAGATTWSYLIRDWRGMGDWRSIYGQNIPTVGMGMEKVNIPIKMGAVSSRIDTEEVRQFMYGERLSLETEYRNIMQMAYERHIEGAFWYGDPNNAFLPMLDYPNSTVISSPSEWSAMDPDDILAELNAYIMTVGIMTGLNMFPNTIALPPRHVGYLAGQARGQGTDTTTLNYFLQNNYVTATTGRTFRVIAVPYLENAGTSDTSRMIVAHVSGDTFQMAHPLTLDFQQPQLEDFSIKIFAEYKFSPVHVPYPTAMLYVDGI